MDQDEEECPLHHVEYHAAEGDLEGPEVRVDGEDVDELQVGEDVGGGEEALGDQHRVPRVPLVPAMNEVKNSNLRRVPFVIDNHTPARAIQDLSRPRAILCWIIMILVKENHSIYSACQFCC